MSTPRFQSLFEELYGIVERDSRIIDLSSAIGNLVRMQPLGDQFSCVSSFPLPSLIRSRIEMHKDDLEPPVCRMGIFPQISHIWVTIGPKLYMFDYQSSAKVIELTLLSDALFVHLYLPPDGIFSKETRFLMAVVLESSVHVFSLIWPVPVPTIEDTPRADALMTVSTTNLDVPDPSRPAHHLCAVEAQPPFFLTDTYLLLSIPSGDVTDVCSGGNGRLFLGTKGGHILELVIDTLSVCRLVNRTKIPVLGDIPLLGDLFARRSIKQLVMDQSRGILHALLENSEIYSYVVSTGSSSLLERRQFFYFKRLKTYKTLRTDLLTKQVDFCHIVQIRPIACMESNTLHLAALLSSGLELYFSLFNSTAVGEYVDMRAHGPFQRDSTESKDLGFDYHEKRFTGLLLRHVHKNESLRHDSSFSAYFRFPGVSMLQTRGNKLYSLNKEIANSSRRQYEFISEIPLQARREADRSAQTVNAALASLNSVDKIADIQEVQCHQNPFLTSAASRVASIEDYFSCTDPLTFQYHLPGRFFVIASIECVYVLQLHTPLDILRRCIVEAFSADKQQQNDSSTSRVLRVIEELDSLYDPVDVCTMLLAMYCFATSETNKISLDVLRNSIAVQETVGTRTRIPRQNTPRRTSPGTLDMLSPAARNYVLSRLEAYTKSAHGAGSPSILFRAYKNLYAKLLRPLLLRPFWNATPSSLAHYSEQRIGSRPTIRSRSAISSNQYGPRSTIAGVRRSLIERITSSKLASVHRSKSTSYTRRAQASVVQKAGSASATRPTELFIHSAILTSACDSFMGGRTIPPTGDAPHSQRGAISSSSSSLFTSLNWSSTELFNLGGLLYRITSIFSSPVGNLMAYHDNASRGATTTTIAGRSAESRFVTTFDELNKMTPYIHEIVTFMSLVLSPQFVGYCAHSLNNYASRNRTTIIRHFFRESDREGRTGVPGTKFSSLYEDTDALTLAGILINTEASKLLIEEIIRSLSIAAATNLARSGLGASMTGSFSTANTSQITDDGAFANANNSLALSNLNTTSRLLSSTRQLKAAAASNATITTLAQKLDITAHRLRSCLTFLETFKILCPTLYSVYYIRIEVLTKLNAACISGRPEEKKQYVVQAIKLLKHNMDSIEPIGPIIELLNKTLLHVISIRLLLYYTTDECVAHIYSKVLDNDDCKAVLSKAFENNISYATQAFSDVLSDARSSGQQNTLAKDGTPASGGALSIIKRIYEQGYDAVRGPDAKSPFGIQTGIELLHDHVRGTTITTGLSGRRAERSSSLSSTFYDAVQKLRKQQEAIFNILEEQFIFAHLQEAVQDSKKLTRGLSMVEATIQGSTQLLWHQDLYLWLYGYYFLFSCLHEASTKRSATAEPDNVFRGTSSRRILLGNLVWSHHGESTKTNVSDNAEIITVLSVLKRRVAIVLTSIRTPYIKNFLEITDFELLADYYERATLTTKACDILYHFATDPDAQCILPQYRNNAVVRSKISFYSRYDMLSAVYAKLQDPNVQIYNHYNGGLLHTFSISTALGNSHNFPKLQTGLDTRANSADQHLLSVTRQALAIAKVQHDTIDLCKRRADYGHRSGCDRSATTSPDISKLADSLLPLDQLFNFALNNSMSGICVLILLGQFSTESSAANQSHLLNAWTAAVTSPNTLDFDIESIRESRINQRSTVSGDAESGQTERLFYSESKLSSVAIYDVLNRIDLQSISESVLEMPIAIYSQRSASTIFGTQDELPIVDAAADIFVSVLFRNSVGVLNQSIFVPHMLDACDNVSKKVHLLVSSKGGRSTSRATAAIQDLNQCVRFDAKTDIALMQLILCFIRFYLLDQWRRYIHSSASSDQDRKKVLIGRNEGDIRRYLEEVVKTHPVSGQHLAGRLST